MKVGIARLTLPPPAYTLNHLLDTMENGVFYDVYRKGSALLLIDEAYDHYTSVFNKEELSIICYELIPFKEKYSSVILSIPQCEFEQYDIPDYLEHVLEHVWTNSLNQVCFKHKQYPDIEFIVMSHE